MSSYRYDKPAYQLSALERAQQSKQDKQVGLFRKKKGENKTPKKTKVAEFDFRPGGITYYDEAGYWGRRSSYAFEGAWELIAEKHRKIIEEGILPMLTPWEDEETKMRDAISKVYHDNPGIEIVYSQVFDSDNTLFQIRKRGTEKIHEVKLSNTTVASMSVDGLATYLADAVKLALISFPSPLLEKRTVTVDLGYKTLPMDVWTQMNNGKEEQSLDHWQFFEVGTLMPDEYITHSLSKQGWSVKDINSLIREHKKIMKQMEGKAPKPKTPTETWAEKWAKENS